MEFMWYTDKKKIALIILSIICIAIVIDLIYVFIYPSLLVENMKSKTIVNATSSLEKQAVSNAERIYYEINASKRKVENNPDIMNLLKEEIGDKTFLISIISGEHRIWTMFFKINDGKIMTLMENVDREADCYVWMDYKTMAKLEENYEVAIVEVAQGKIKIAPPGCYGDFLTLMRLREK